MAVTTNKVIRLTFTTAGGKTFAVTIPDPRENLDKAEAEAVMDTIIQKNVFVPSDAVNRHAETLAWIRILIEERKHRVRCPKNFRSLASA
ncbi:MAG TPA: DUF2922 domain-containing protein [Desulfosporosinus sp.]|nr:DUF2922 domain-containing protein [Desulfosporosinus sp.]